jgi:plasmid maintenance system killer protein
MDAIIEIYWQDSKLQKFCATSRRGQKRWGADGWKILSRRLALIEAASTLASLDNAPGSCHALTADRAGEFAMALWRGYRLIFEPANNPLPRDPDGHLIRSEVTKVLIKEVVDYHG